MSLYSKCLCEKDYIWNQEINDCSKKEEIFSNCVEARGENCGKCNEPTYCLSSDFKFYLYFYFSIIIRKCELNEKDFCETHFIFVAFNNYI